jgi:putative membrane protein insertion efficiency factor
VWVSGAPARLVLIGSIRLYRVTLSGLLGGQCRFYPSCSHYAEDAIRAYGAVRGTVMSAWRVARCNPFGRGGVEHAVDIRQYDTITPNRDPGAAA